MSDSDISGAALAAFSPSEHVLTSCSTKVRISDGDTLRSEGPVGAQARTGASEAIAAWQIFPA